MQSQAQTLIYENLIDSLATKGYAVVPQFISTQAVRKLAMRAFELHQQGLLSPATTGKNTQLNEALRGDATRWLADSDEHPTEQFYIHLMRDLQDTLNRTLFLGLHTLESHFAVYPTGAFYKKHLDQFSTDRYKQDDLRKVSCILYLNDAWQADDGGELRLYLDDGSEQKTLDILPMGGTLVAFLSERFYHEVLPAKRDRISITGWFKTRANLAI